MKIHYFYFFTYILHHNLLVHCKVIKISYQFAYKINLNICYKLHRVRCTFKLIMVRKNMLLFLPCDAMRSTVLVIVILSVRLSVCLSVRPSVTLVDCVHMVRPTIMISSPYGSPIILVSGDITFIPKFEGGHPERGR